MFNNRKVKVLEDELSYSRALIKAWRWKYDELASQWNSLIDTINAKGGKEWLDNATLGGDLTKDDIEAMIRLCHPDKHEGKTVANNITRKLIEMRNNYE